MIDSCKHSIQFILGPLWRQKCLFLSGCLVWTIFYLLLHFSTSSPDISEQYFIKTPIDSVRGPEPDSRPQNTGHYGDSNQPQNNDFSLKGASLPFNTPTHGANQGIFDDLTSKPKSVREKYSAKGVKHTSFVVEPKKKPNTARSPGKTDSTAALRFVHFDLKGAPPKLSFFKSIFPVLKRAGANGILLEYEDTFPFWGALSIVSAKNAYKKKDIQYILKLARRTDLQVIPLIQTFGHLEFILKLPEFQHLREVRDTPQSVCPTNNSTLVLIRMMVDQVMAMHPNSRWLHIGNDEVYQLGQCARCSRYDRNSLFLTYVKKVATYVREQHKVIPIIWDDMLRHATVSELERYQIGKLVEPMVWSYVEDVSLFLPTSLWEKYSQVFPFVWSASAFKGAFGETLTVPDAKRHLANNRAWLALMSEQNISSIHFRGIVLTGWQRYDHFASLCELLPAGLPSLVLNLLTVTRGRFDAEVFPQMQTILECSSPMHYHLDFEKDPNLWRAAGMCFFPGSPVFRLTLRHAEVVKSLNKYIEDLTIHKGWMTEYNVKHNFSSPLRVDEMLRDFGYYNSSLQMLQEAAVKALREVYDDDTVSEWIELNVYPHVIKMNKVWERGENLKKFQTWPRRPLPRTIHLPLTATDTRFVVS